MTPLTPAVTSAREALGRVLGEALPGDGAALKTAIEAEVEAEAEGA